MQREEQAAFQGYIDASRGIEPTEACFWRIQPEPLYLRHAGKLGILAGVLSATIVFALLYLGVKAL